MNRPATYGLRAALALLLAAVSIAAQGTPITLQRLTEALDSKALGEKDIAEIVLEVGVSFSLTGEIEKDLRRRGASDLVILAVRNGYRPPLPPGPAEIAAIADALEKGVSSVDIVAHVERDGVAGAFDAPSRDRLAAAGASPVLQRIVANRWLDASKLDGSLEQIEALLAAGADSDKIAAKLGAAPLAFPADRETFSRLSLAHGTPALQRAVAATFLEGLQEPLTLDQIVVMQGAGIEPAELAKRVAEVGTDFETAEDAAEQLRAAGVDAAISEAVIARRIGAAKGPLSLVALAQAIRSSVPEQDIVEAVQSRGVDFTLTNQTGAALASFPDPIRIAGIVQALGQQGYRAFRLPRSNSYDSGADRGLLDVRLTVDHVEDVVVVDDVLLVKNLRGTESVDQGSEVTQSLPKDLDPNTFAVELKDGRGQMSAYWMPEKDNGYILRARIFDEKGGSDRYHMRLTWRRGGANAGGARRDAPSLQKN
jgi:hypothetical protein